MKRRLEQSQVMSTVREMQLYDGFIHTYTRTRASHCCTTVTRCSRMTVEHKHSIRYMRTDRQDRTGQPRSWPIHYTSIHTHMTALLYATPP